MAGDGRRQRLADEGPRQLHVAQRLGLEPDHEPHERVLALPMADLFEGLRAERSDA